MPFHDLPAAFQPIAARVLEAALAGHPVLLIGPPGLGSTLIARRVPAALPPMTGDEIAAVTWRYIAAGLAEGPITSRPFRAPHHTINRAAMLGVVRPGICGECRGRGPVDCRCKGRGTVATSRLRPGELHLARSGVLLLDEAPEFRRDVLAAVFGPHRNGYAIIGTALPCPCGWRGSKDRMCSCTEAFVSRYEARIRGLFRVQIEMPPVSLAV